jgi:hypothetical protein
MNLRIEKLLNMRKQLRIIFPDQVALIEAFAHISPNDPVYSPPSPSYIQKVLDETEVAGSEPPKKRAK